MNNKMRLKRSNAAHMRLARRPLSTQSVWIDRSYHYSGFEDQKKIGRILTRAEKKSKYELARFDYDLSRG